MLRCRTSVAVPTPQEQKKQLRFWTGTYNVNGKRERALILSHWLQQGWESQQPDFFVIALQETIDLSATNVLKDSMADTASRGACDDWVVEFRRAFEYVAAFAPGFEPPSLVARENMCGIAVLVFSKEPVAAATARIRTGTAGLGNKGACVVRWRQDDSDLCFVGAHLSAHRNDVEARNADYEVIVQKRCFKRDRFGVSALVDDAGYETLGILDHDIVVFLGDLNYRIDKARSDKEVHYLMKENLPKLMMFDQLNAERGAKRAFQSFVEPPVDFAPTYKYVPGTSRYDYETDAKKVRCPAWCDRVLYRVAPAGPRGKLPESVVCAQYARADDRLKISDHRPVHAVLDITVRKLDKRLTSGKLLFGEKHKKTTKLPLEPTSLWLRAGVACDVTLSKLEGVLAFCFTNVPGWLVLEPEAGTFDDEEIALRATARLTDADKATLAENGGVLGANVLLHCGDYCFVVPVCLTSAPHWSTRTLGGGQAPPQLPARPP